MQIRSLLILPDIRENVLIENRLVLRGQVQTCRNRLIQNRFFGGNLFFQNRFDRFIFVLNSSTRGSQLDEDDKLDDVGVRRWLVDSDVDEGVASDAHNATLNEDESKTFLFRRKKIFSYLFFSRHNEARDRVEVKSVREGMVLSRNAELSLFSLAEGKTIPPPPFVKTLVVFFLFFFHPFCWIKAEELRMIGLTTT